MRKNKGAKTPSNMKAMILIRIRMLKSFSSWLSKRARPVIAGQFLVAFMVHTGYGRGHKIDREVGL